MSAQVEILKWIFLSAHHKPNSPSTLFAAVAFSRLR
jgi:hypothetical protein